MINCMIAGVGGQGTVFASKLIASAAMERGLHVRTTETIGMAQRGGSVTSHVRMGEQIHSPLVPLGAADIIIAFEPAEGVRLTPFLAENGLMIVCDSAIKPVTSSLGGGYDGSVMLDYLKANTSDPVIVSGDLFVAEFGDAKALNVALLGTAVQSGRFPFNATDIENVIKAKTPERFLKMNLAAFGFGKEMYAPRKGENE